MNLIQNYKIHCDTYLISNLQEGDKPFTVVYEKGRQLHVANKPLKLIDAACQAIGSSFQTASQAARNILGNKLKVPIIVGFENNIPYIMFPLYSPKSTHNTWIAYNAITNITNHKKNITLTFKDDTQVDIDILISSFNNQYVSASIISKSLERNWRNFNSSD